MQSPNSSTIGIQRSQFSIGKFAMTSVRRKARIAALQALYEFDCAGHDPVSSVMRLAQEKQLPEEAVAFARDMTAGIIEHQAELDMSIRKFAPSFPIEQLALIDKNILRLAIFEILISENIPNKVAINEAVELAKAFGSRNSPKFVNGVLGSVNSMVLQR